MKLKKINTTTRDNKILLAKMLRDSYTKDGFKEALEMQELNEFQDKLIITIIRLSAKDSSINAIKFDLQELVWKIKSEKDLLDLYNGNF